MEYCSGRWHVPCSCLALVVLVPLLLSGCGGGGKPGPSGPGGQTCTNERDGDYPGCGVSKMTYSANNPIPGWKFLSKYFPVDTPADECTDHICDCPAQSDIGIPTWKVQQGRVYAKRAGATGSGGHAGNGFGLHLVNVSQHWTTGGKTTKDVENIFTERLGDMTKFDAFMDYNIVLGTEGLQAYKDTFKADDVPYLASTWHSADGKDYTSIFVRVPNTQMILELVQQTSLIYAGDEKQPQVLEQRVSMPALRAHEGRTKLPRANTQKTSSASVGAIITPLALNRGASEESMSKIDGFYSGMGATKTHDSDDGNIKKKCYRWSGATVDVCFTQRPDQTGKWSVHDFETMLNTVHENIIRGFPLCGMDKWEDNHYAVDSRSFDPSGIVRYINHEKPLHLCTSSKGSASLHYIWDPTGWGVQLNMAFKSAPDDCASSRIFNRMMAQKAQKGKYNPVCTIDLSVCPKQNEKTQIEV